MRPRPDQRFSPGLERCEARSLLSAGPSTPRLANLRVVPTADPTGALGDLSRNPAGLGARMRLGPGRLGTSTGRGGHPRPSASPPASAGLTLFRITDPTRDTARLVPPFHQTLVQSAQPVPGEVYNILSVSVRNGTARTFDASSGLSVRVTGQKQSFPILTGDEQWKPGEFFVFYILTKEYYPLRPVTSAGFEFDLAGNRGVAIPGPSGIFLRVTYKPDTFARMLDWIVVHGPGAKGHELGLPDTAIWEITSARTDIVPL